MLKLIRKQGSVRITSTANKIEQRYLLLIMLRSDQIFLTMAQLSSLWIVDCKAKACGSRSKPFSRTRSNSQKKLISITLANMKQYGKGSFTYDVITEGEGVSKRLCLITRGGLADKYVIKNVRNFHKFLLKFG